MRLYLDSFVFNDWDRFLPTGLFYGITTNPLLAERAGHFYHQINWCEVIERAHMHAMRELHIQLPEFGEAALGFLDRLEADRDRANGTHSAEIIIKIPLTEAGIRLAPQVRARGFRILMTACYHAKQMFVAEGLGAAFIAPYYGRMIESGMDARQHLRFMRDIGKSSAAPCEVLVASLRHVDQMLELASDGHDLFTISADIAADLLLDTQTEAATEAFIQSAKG